LKKSDSVIEYFLLYFYNDVPKGGTMRYLKNLGGALLLLVTSSVSAIPMTGIISTVIGGGMTGTGSWANGGAVFSYSVEQLSSGNWQYDYRWTAMAKDLSHIIIGVSPSFTELNVLNGTTAGWELDTFGAAQGASNVGIPGDLYGLKFPGFDLDDFFTIVTDRAPVWTSVYAKDGKDVRGTIDVFAYNDSFGLSTTVPIDSVQPFGFILGPDSVGGGGGNIPEPSTLPLALLGLAGFAFRRKVRIQPT
jgi:hypothetical protein